MKNIAVFASGRGSNFSAIAQSVKKNKIKANLALLICDKISAPVIDKAKRAHVKVVLVIREDYRKSNDFENAIAGVLRKEKIDLIVLAGFMRMLSGNFVSKFRNKIINIHPALLPSFKGSQAIKDAFSSGAKFTGVTVHFVDELMDHGPIILQQALKIEAGCTLALLEKKIHQVEHRIYPEAIRLFIGGKLKVSGRKVRISAR